MQALMTEELTKGLPPLYATEGVGDPMALAHCFSPLNGLNWYLTEHNPATGEAFDLVRGFETERGYFFDREMEELNRLRNLSAVERDERFEPTRVSALEGMLGMPTVV